LKGILFYFSGTGNTRWAADNFKSKLEKMGVSIELHNMESEAEYNLSAYDFFILGTPVHAEIPPKNVHDFVNKLPHSDSAMRVMLFSTQGAEGAACLDIIREVLVKKGYNVTNQVFIQMVNNYWFFAGKKPSMELFKKRKLQAERKIQRAAEDFYNNKNYRDKVGFGRVVFSKLMQRTFYRSLPKMSTSITSSSDCHKCGECLRNCPKGNITFENGHALFHGNCIMCMRCIHICPVNAVRYKGRKIEQTQSEMIKNLDLK